MKQRIVRTLEDVDRLEADVYAAADVSVRLLTAAAQARPGMGALAAIKFTTLGRDPLNKMRPLNLIEQVNQTFTYLATFSAARWLLSRHPECAPLTLNLGTAAGYDIQSACGLFVAETFSATRPDSNDKLTRDLSRMLGSTAPHRFVFVLSPVRARIRSDVGVEVVQLTHPVIDAIVDADSKTLEDHNQ